jgi:hypothetical protein
MVASNCSQAASFDPHTPATPPEHPADGDGQHRHRPSLEEGFAQFSTLAGQLKESLTYLVSAKVDAARVSLYRIFLLAVLGIVGGIAAITIAITSAVLLLIGAAHGLGVAFGNRFWLGQLVLGFALLAGMALVACIFYKRRTTASLNKTVAKYEYRQEQQRKRFGRNIPEVAAARSASH